MLGMEFVHLQFSAFLVLLFTGMVWGGFFDLYRVFRSRIKVNRMIDAVGDLIFWFLAALLVFPLIYWGTWLELRFFVRAALLVGLGFYYYFLSNLLMPVYKVFWRIAGWLPGIVMTQLWRFGLTLRRIVRFFRKR